VREGDERQRHLAFAQKQPANVRTTQRSAWTQGCFWTQSSALLWQGFCRRALLSQMAASFLSPLLFPLRHKMLQKRIQQQEAARIVAGQTAPSRWLLPLQSHSTNSVSAVVSSTVMMSQIFVPHAHFLNVCKGVSSSWTSKFESMG